MNDAEKIATLQGYFKDLGLPADASLWLTNLYHVIQVFDDMADGEAVGRDSLDATIWFTLYQMPTNPFFIQNAHELLPALSSMILAWQASDRMERTGMADARSYMLRASYYDVVMKACQLALGAEWAIKNASLVYSLYGESYEQYRKEFPNA